MNFRKTSRSGKTATAVVAGIVLVAALAAIGYQWFAKAGGPPDDKTSISIAEPFLDEIRQGRVDAAWESTTAEFKSMTGKEDFKKFVNEQPALKEPLEF